MTNAPVQDANGEQAEILPPGDGSIWRALFGGLIVAALLSWFLLSAGLSLPFMLGVFFFMLFGLIVGSVMFRCGEASRPVAKSKIVVATALVSLVCWGIALGREAVEFPEDFVEKALKKVYMPPDGYDQVVGELHVFINDYLEKEYPPGGPLGYLRYAATGRTIEVETPSQPKPIPVKPMARAWTWWTRTVLSLVLFFVATYAIAVDLSKDRKPLRSARRSTASRESAGAQPPSSV